MQCKWCLITVFTAKVRLCDDILTWSAKVSSLHVYTLGMNELRAMTGKSLASVMWNPWHPPCKAEGLWDGPVSNRKSTNLCDGTWYLFYSNLSTNVNTLTLTQQPVTLTNCPRCIMGVEKTKWWSSKMYLLDLHWCHSVAKNRDWVLPSKLAEQRTHRVSRENSSEKDLNEAVSLQLSTVSQTSLQL